ncbi:MAG: AbrB/MazE/SpoVT family DNA-binding domain-containing protein [Actinomycetota bacterium]
MFTAVATISSKRQITVPKKLWEDLKVKTGDKLIFTKRGDEIVVKSVKGTPEEMIKYLGRDLKKGADVMAIHYEFEVDDEYR